jgi:hypothetical protein
MFEFDFFLIDKCSIGNSEKAQDTFLKYIFDVIGFTNKYYVEFGSVDGYDGCNTLYFRERENWKGLLLEGNPSVAPNPSINLHIHRINKDNICSLFEQYDVPLYFDLLSIDLDGNDFWILNSILKVYNPRVIMIETNVRFEPFESMVMKYDQDWVWDGRKWYGASPYAYKKMMDFYGYTPLFMCEDDMIAVSTEVINSLKIKAPEWIDVYPCSNKNLYSKQVGSIGTIISELDESNWEFY